jgi:phosphoribosylamine--glycine ligase
MYSQSGEGAQVLKKIELEGNSVALFIKDKAYKTVFDGLLEKTENPFDFIDDDTVIIFDISGNGKIADNYKKHNLKVFGASSFADKLEQDREFGYEMMVKSGIKVPNYKEFSSFEDGKKYVTESQLRLVFKPSGSMPCKLTYVSKDASELLAYMDFVEKHYGDKIDSFVLQEFIEGIVVSSEFFCDGTRFIHPGNHTVEVKKSMNDDLGPSTGCSGNITWLCEDDKIMEAGVSKLEKLCVENGYVGQIDLNVVVNDSGLYGLEFTPRFGYDATPTLLGSVDMDLGKFFSDICSNQMKEFPIFDTYAGAVRLTIPPYPVETEKDPEDFSPSIGVPILNSEEYQDECYFYEVKMEDEVLQHAGGSGVILCGLSDSDRADNCLDRAYEILENVTVPDKQYRTDLNKVLPKMVKEVNKYA